MMLKNYFIIEPYCLADIKMGQNRDRREYFKSYYKNISDDKKEELRRKRRS